MYINFNLKLVALFSWTLLILVLLLSPMPFESVQESTSFADKIVHAVLFGVLAFLIFILFDHSEEDGVMNPERKFYKKKKTSRKKYIRINNLLQIFLITFLISTTMSIILEYVQVYIPGRSSNDYDLLSSVIGIVLVLIFIYGDNYSQKEA